MRFYEEPEVQIAMIDDIVATDPGVDGDNNELPGVGSDNSVGGLGG